VDERTATLRELVRLATLAPSSHNTQCWRFRLDASAATGEDEIAILPDLSRRCPVADPDDHHLHVSLGCAAENIVQAAAAMGRRASVATTTSGDDGRGEVAIRIPRSPPLSPDQPAADDADDADDAALAAAIPERQCTRSEYDGSSLTPEELRRLEAVAPPGSARLVLLTARSDMERVLEFVASGNRTQLHDPAFVRELESWIRFNESEAEAAGDGLSSRASGNPSLPRWLGRIAFRVSLSARRMNDQYARQIRSSAAVAIVVSDHDEFADRVEAGRVYQRLALRATSMGIRNAFINQPVEVAALRPEFAAAMGLGSAPARPNLIVRLGRGAVMPRSHRRPVDEVIVH